MPRSADKRFNKVVIGGGISGCVFGMYHPDSLVIGEECAQEDSPFVFLQKNSETSRLIADLGLPDSYTRVSVKADHLDSGSIVLDKIGGNAPLLRWHEGTDRIAGIGPNRTMLAYNYPLSKITSIIRKGLKNRFLNRKVIQVEPDCVLLNSGETICCSEIISTIPFQAFSKICSYWEEGPNVSILPALFEIEEAPDLESCSIEYLSGQEDGRTKLVKNAICGKIGIEYSQECAKRSDKAKMVRVVGKINPPPEGVVFSGRLATANSHWRIEDSIFLAREGFLFSKMLAEQKRFDSAIKDKTGVVGERRVENLVLHITSELGEMLREINWKSNVKPRKTIKATSVLEEGIDILKLVMSILLEFDYTEREIAEAFFGKSKKLWDKFLTEFYGGI